MPPDMFLRSDWKETSLSAPGNPGTIDRWSRWRARSEQEPIPLQKFLRYAEWFRETFVRGERPADVAARRARHGRYRLETAAGDEVDARQVVVAVGAVPFAQAPPLARRTLLGDRVSYAPDPQDYEAVSRAAGSSSSEAARAGSRARRSPPARAPTSSSSCAPGSTGSPTASPTAARPAAPAALPTGVPGRGVRAAAAEPACSPPRPVRGAAQVPLAGGSARRVLRSGGSPWLRAEVEHTVKIREGVAVEGIEQNGDVRLHLSDGTVREADAVIVAAGFRFSLDRLTFLSPGLREQISVEEGWPVLDRCFRSTADDLLFVGFAAEKRFGPGRPLHPGNGVHGQPRAGGSRALEARSCAERVAVSVRSSRRTGATPSM